jgi:hypothetical protein
MQVSATQRLRRQSRSAQKENLLYQYYRMCVCRSFKARFRYIQRLPRDKLETSCLELVSSLSATSSGRLDLVSEFQPSNRGNRHLAYGQTVSTCEDALFVRRASLKLVGLLDAIEFGNARNTTNFHRFVSSKSLYSGIWLLGRSPISGEVQVRSTIGYN